MTGSWRGAFTALCMACLAGQVGAQSCPSFSFSSSVLLPTVNITKPVVKVVDYNGDGIPDIAYLKTPRLIAVALGAGDGTFSPAATVDPGGAVTDFSWVDLNRDGRIDLVVTYSAGLRTYLQRSDGTLAVYTLPAIPPTLPGSTAAFGNVIAGDFNGDGYPDLAVVNLGMNRLEFRLGNAAGLFTYQPQELGDHRLEGGAMSGLALGRDGLSLLAGFAEPGRTGSGGRMSAQGFWRFEANNFSTPMQHGPQNVIAADLDGDGLSDWVVNEHGDGYLTVVSKGAVKSSTPIQPRVADLAAGDFNGDGKVDVAIAQELGNVSILAGDGRGGLATPKLAGVAFTPGALSVADFNQDGAADIVYHDATSGGRLILLTNRCVAQQPELHASAMDVVQTINDLALDVPLVAGKRTFVRVQATSSTPLALVAARLRGIAPSGASLGAPLLPINDDGRLALGTSFDRQRVDSGYLFELPTSWLAEGRVRLEATINEPASVTPAASSSPVITREVEFVKVPPLPVTLYEVTWRTNKKPITTRSDDVDLGIWGLVRQFPTPSLSIERKAIDIAWDDGGFSLGPELTVDLINELRATFNPWPGHGLAYFFIDAVRGGNSDHIPGTVALGAPNVIAHEFGHLLGLHHVIASVDSNGRTCGLPDDPLPFPYPDGRVGGPASEPQRYVGFDSGSVATARPDGSGAPLGVVVSNTPEMMSYCFDMQWFSDVSQRTLQQSITDRFPVSGKMKFASKSISSGTARTWLAVHASLDKTSGELVRLRTRRFIDSREPVAPQGDGYRVRFEDAAGATVSDAPFGAQAMPDVTGFASIAVVVPWPDNAVSFHILQDGTGRVLATRALAAKQPVVSSFTVNALDGNRSRFELRWGAASGSGKPLRYWLSYRPTADSDWEPVAIELTTPSYTVTSANLAGTYGATTGQFRIQALDELDSTQALSTWVNVPGKAPGLLVGSPATGTSISPGQSLTLQAVAWDVDDPVFDQASITWQSDRDGLIGTGDLVTFTPRATGLHHLSATVVGREGRRTTKDRWIRVSSAAEPLITCVTQTNRITMVGGADTLGRRWERSVTQAVNDIRAGSHYSLVSATGGFAKIIAVRARSGSFYLRATPSHGLGDNLLGLPRCHPN